MSSPPDSVTVRAPGKINLRLGVGPLRPDGFHDLITVFHAVDLFDEVVAAPADRLSVVVEGPDAAAVPTDRRNLAWQAAALLSEASGERPGVRLTIRKRIPVAGGMAGGSADAAAALVACARLWQLDDDVDDLFELACELGSDVAFPLTGGTALGTGRGEVLLPLDTNAALHWVLVLADHGISAGAAYAELDRQRAQGAPAPQVDGLEELLGALAAGDVPAVAARLGNDLQPAAVSLAPQLAGTLDLGRQVGALASLVAGSGPTVALLYADADAARTAADTLRGRGLRVQAASGPVAGAQVVR